MSYALVEPRYYSGFGATAPTKLPSIPNLLPTQAEAAGDLQPYIDIANAVSPPPGFDPTNPDTWKPELMIPYGIRVVTELQKNLGLLPLDTGQILAVVKGDVKWLDDMGIPITSIPTNVRDMCVLFARCSAVAACKQLGIPPEIGTATVDALSDGEFTAEDVQSIGGVAGGMGGSYLCGLIGVPPQVGGYVGSLAGKIVGGAVSDLLDIGGGKSARDEAEKQKRAARDAVRKQLETIRGQYQGLMGPTRALYWETFDHLLQDLENFWEKTECMPGIEGIVPVKFPLLWGANGLAQGLSPGVEPFLRYRYNAATCPPQTYTLMKDAARCLTGTLIQPGTATGCPSMFGCPYPGFAELGAGPAERVAQAFAAYNQWWVQPSNRSANTTAWQQALPPPSAEIVNFIARRTQERAGCKTDTCRKFADRDVGNYVARYQAVLNEYLDAAGPGAIYALGMRIQSDIIATGSVYASAAVLRAQKTELRQGQMGRLRAILGDPAALRSAERNARFARIAGPTLNGALNYGLPALGALLCLAALRRKR